MTLDTVPEPDSSNPIHPFILLPLYELLVCQICQYADAKKHRAVMIWHMPSPRASILRGWETSTKTHSAFLSHQRPSVSRTNRADPQSCFHYAATPLCSWMPSHLFLNWAGELFSDLGGPKRFWSPGVSNMIYEVILKQKKEPSRRSQDSIHC